MRSALSSLTAWTLATGLLLAAATLAPADAGQPPPTEVELAPAHSVAGEWTGYLTDSHCGRHCANGEHTAAALEKNLKGGAKPQIYDEADGKLYTLDGFEKVKTLVGVRVTVKGSLDPSTSVISVESAREASPR